jgi:hypothetical protein
MADGLMFLLIMAFGLIVLFIVAFGQIGYSVFSPTAIYIIARGIAPGKNVPHTIHLANGHNQQ